LQHGKCENCANAANGKFKWAIFSQEKWFALFMTISKLGTAQKGKELRNRRQTRFNYTYRGALKIRVLKK